MKIMSFNINGIRARLHQLAALLEKHQPDILGLQEIKVHNDMFPVEDVEKLGYSVYFHGQKGHYGVAFLTKNPAASVQYGFPSDDEDAQKRMIIVEYKDSNDHSVHVLNGYFPQGESRDHPTKFPYKEKFYQDLQHYIEQNHTIEDRLAIIGDFNISHQDIDIGITEDSRKRWLRTGKCSFLPEEREWLEKLMSFGFTDTFRQLHPNVADKFSWFDYRSKGFLDNRGLRIDLIITTPALSNLTLDAGIDYELRGIEKPSDHAPIWTTFSD